MRAFIALVVALLAPGLATFACGEGPVAPRPAEPDPLLLAQGKDKEKDKDKKDQPMPDPFVQAPPETVAAPTRVSHHVIGDLPGFSILQIVTVPANRQFTFNVPSLVRTDPLRIILQPTTVTLPGTLTNTVRVPIASRGSFKIG